MKVPTALFFGGRSHGTTYPVPTGPDGLPIPEVLAPGDFLNREPGDPPAVSIDTYRRAGDQPGPGGFWRYVHPDYTPTPEV